MPGYLLSALEDLRSASLDGIHTVSRALGALEVSATGVIGKADEMADNHGNLSEVDRATRDVRNLLNTAMDAIYDAARIIERLS